MSNSEEERMVSNMLTRGQRIPKHLMNKYGLYSNNFKPFKPRAAKMTANEKLAHRIKFSLPYRWRPTPNWVSWDPKYMSGFNIQKYVRFKNNNSFNHRYISINNIVKEIQKVKKITSREKALLMRLYEPYFSNIGSEVRNNAKIKPVRNWYIGILSKKYGIPKNWFEDNPAIAWSKAARYIEYALTKKYAPHYANKNIAGKQLARKVSRVYSAALNRRIATAKKAVKTLPSPVRERVLNTAFPGTRRHRSPSVGRTFN